MRAIFNVKMHHNAFDKLASVHSQKWCGFIKATLECSCIYATQMCSYYIHRSGLNSKATPLWLNTGTNVATSHTSVAKLCSLWTQPRESNISIKRSPPSGQIKEDEKLGTEGSVRKQKCMGERGERSGTRGKRLSPAKSCWEWLSVIILLGSQTFVHWTRLHMKLFRTSNRDIINECCSHFCFKLPSEILPARFDSFLCKLQQLRSL